MSQVCNVGVFVLDIPETAGIVLWPIARALSQGGKRASNHVHAHKGVTVSFSRRTKAVSAIAGASAAALILAGCAGGGDTPAEPGGPITLTITTFGNFGYDDLLKEYEAAHEGITIEHIKAADGGAGREDLFKRIATDTVADVAAIEEGFVAAITSDPAVAAKFADLNTLGGDKIADRWLSWKNGYATTPDGKFIGYGTDIGPQGLSFRGDLLAKVGAGTRDEFTAKLGGANASWDNFFALGKEYKNATGKAFYPNSSAIWNSFVNQQAEGYYKKDGTTLNIEGNEALKGFLGQLLDAQQAGLSLNLNFWDGALSAEAQKNNDFAVHVTPGWMLGVVKGWYPEDQRDKPQGWDFADVYPGGATNWGGAWLAVAENSPNKQAAADLAAWLTAPEQQVKAFKAAGPFPSTKEGGEAVAAENALDPFFNNAPTGAILANRAVGVTPQVKGKDDALIQEKVFGPILSRLDNGEFKTVDEAWDAALKLLKEQLS